MKKNIKKKYGIIHGIAECEDCNWKTASYKNVQAISATHARKYNHKVIGDLGITFEYDGRQNKR